MAEEKAGVGEVAAWTIAAIVIAVVLWALVRSVHLGRWGLELPLIGFLVGLAVSAATGAKARRAFQRLSPWVFVDASLILIGITANFSRLGGLGGKAGVIAVVNVAAGLIIGMLIAIRLGLDERFAAAVTAGGTICGITAAIAAGRAAEAEYPHLLAAMLIIAVIGLPFALAASIVAPSLGAAGGALIGAMVDSTPVVKGIAEEIGGVVGQVALAVKFAQNALIPIAAIALGIAAAKLGGTEEAKIPLALILMLVLAIVTAFTPLSKNVVDALENARNILLGVAMVAAGMATPVEELRKPGIHLAIIVFIVLEIVNIVVALGLGGALLG